MLQRPSRPVGHDLPSPITAGWGPTRRTRVGPPSLQAVQVWCQGPASVANEPTRLVQARQQVRRRRSQAQHNSAGRGHGSKPNPASEQSNNRHQRSRNTEAVLPQSEQPQHEHGKRAHSSANRYGRGGRRGPKGAQEYHQPGRRHRREPARTGRPFQSAALGGSRKGSSRHGRVGPNGNQGARSSKPERKRAVRPSKLRSGKGTRSANGTNQRHNRASSTPKVQRRHQPKGLSGVQRVSTQVPRPPRPPQGTGRVWVGPVHAWARERGWSGARTGDAEAVAVAPKSESA